MLKYLDLEVSGINIKPNYDFTGSSIRGVFGIALFNACCPFVVKKDCYSCRFNDNCAYFDFFENIDKSPKFILDLGLKTNKYDFKIRLFENAMRHLNKVLIALENMCEIGLGFDRRLFNFTDLKLNNKKIPRNEDQNFKDHILEFKPNLHRGNYKISILTPMRIKQNGKMLFNNLDFKIFIRQIVMRFEQLSEKNIEKFDITFDKFEQNLTFYKLNRYSNRQETKMDFSGILGELYIYNLDEKSIQFLDLAQIMNIGKSTSFGLGKILLTRLNNNVNL